MFHGSPKLFVFEILCIPPSQLPLDDNKVYKVRADLHTFCSVCPPLVLLMWLALQIWNFILITIFNINLFYIILLSLRLMLILNVMLELPKNHQFSVFKRCVYPKFW